MDIALIIGAHIGGTRLNIAPCVKINRGINSMARVTGVNASFATLVDYTSGGNPYETVASTPVRESTYDSNIDADYGHVHYTVVVPHAFDVGTAVNVTFQMVTVDPDGTNYIVSGVTTGSYTA